MGQYEPPQRLVVHDGVLSAQLDGSDGRTSWLSSADWHAPHLHRDFLLAFIDMTGPGTTRRTSSATRPATWVLNRFMAHVAALHGNDVLTSQLAGSDYRSFRDSWETKSSRYEAVQIMRAFARELNRLGKIRQDFFDAVMEFEQKPERQPISGYDDATFEEIVRVARNHVQEILDRQSEGERLLLAVRDAPDTLTADELAKGECLAELARVGHPPRKRWVWPEGWRTELPPMLFLQREDVAPIMVLMSALSGRNPETIKELTTRHVVREERFLEVELTKRRSQEEPWTVTWEIGGPQRRLRTSGGFYLTMISMMARSRAFAGTDALICIRNKKSGEHASPWKERLADGFAYLKDWVRLHGLTENGEPLELTHDRIRTTVERRRAKDNDYDLDRSAINNTPDVHYRSYVTADSTAREDLQSIVRDVLQEIQDQYAFGEPGTLTGPISARPPVTDEPHASKRAFLGCRNTLGNPDQPDVECWASFLDCFACPCSVVDDERIPTLMKLSEELAERFPRMPLDKWVDRYGQAWVSIHSDILPSRTPEELAMFAAQMPDSTALTLLEDPDMT